MKSKVMSIIPAQPGWYAVYWEEKGGRVRLSTSPVICWAHVRDTEFDDEYDRIEAMDTASGESSAEFCKQNSNFLGLIDPSQEMGMYMNEADAALAESKIKAKV